MLAHRDRSVAIAGLAFLVVALLGTVIAPAEPDFVGDPASAAAFYEGDTDSQLLAYVLYLWTVPLLLWFTVALANVVRRGEATTLPAIIRVAGAAGSALVLAGVSAGTVATLRAEEPAPIAPEVAAVMWDLENAFFGIAAPTALAALVIATALAALRHGVLPRWFGVLSIPLAAGLLATPVAFVAMIVFLFWAAATGVALVVQPGRAEHAPIL